MSESTGATAASTPALEDAVLPSAPAPGEPLLEIRGLKKHFPLTQGIVFGPFTTSSLRTPRAKVH